MVPLEPFRAQILCYILVEESFKSIKKIKVLQGADAQCNKIAKENKSFFGPLSLLLGHFNHNPSNAFYPAGKSAL
jgi:hypothetical protein